MDPPKTRCRSRNLSRDERLRVFSLSEAGIPRKRIAEQLGITMRQVGYTLLSGHLSPKKRTDKHTKLNTEQVDELIAFVCASSANRQMSYLELAMHFSQWNVGETAIKGALARRGYSRYRARVISPTSE